MSKPNTKSKSSLSGHKQKHHQRIQQADNDDDDHEFHDLPKEQPMKKKQKQSATQPILDTSTQQKSASKQQQQQQQQSASSKKKSGIAIATVPVVGSSSSTTIAVGADDEEMDSGDDDNDSETEGTQQKEVKIMTKTQAKESRVYDRPTVNPSDILPNLQSRTPSHVSTKQSASTVTPASEQLLAPLEHNVNSTVASTGEAALRKVIVVLVKASLETVKTKKGYELISADSHKHILQKLSKNPSEYRPDILHQCLLTLLDSPLNKAGLLEVYIQTEKNVLIEVHSSIRIPRTFKRFAGLMGSS